MGCDSLKTVCVNAKHRFKYCTRTWIKFGMSKNIVHVQNKCGTCTHMWPVRFLKYTLMYFADLGVGTSVVDTVMMAPCHHQHLPNLLSNHCQPVCTYPCNEWCCSINQATGREHPPQSEPGASYMTLQWYTGTSSLTSNLMGLECPSWLQAYEGQQFRMTVLH